MDTMSLLSAAALSMAPVTHSATSDPIGPAMSGRLQCYSPDAAHKTCRSLASYARTPDAGIKNTADVLISANPPVIMRTVAPVEIKSGAVCGKIRVQDIAAASFVVNGNPLDEARSQMLRTKLIDAMKSLMDQEICTTYLPDHDGLVAKVTMGGTPQPAMDQRVIWVAPEDGFKVSP